MSVLIFCPTYPSRPLVKQRMLDAVMNLDWPDCDVVFGRDDIQRTDRAAGYRNLFGKYARARAMALAGSYDAMLTVEADVIVPRHALSQLVGTGAPVAYGLYCSRNKHWGPGGHHWLVVTEAGNRYAQPASMDEAFRARAWGEVVESAGHGLGCTLIRREVLEQIPFRMPEDADAACDWYFALDCQAAGIRQVHHCGVQCGHILNDQVALWPHPQTVYRRVEL